MSDFTCKYRNSGAGGNDPQECAWPYCDCDPAATRVLQHFQECGLVLIEDYKLDQIHHAVGQIKVLLRGKATGA